MSAQEGKDFSRRDFFKSSALGAGAMPWLFSGAPVMGAVGGADPATIAEGAALDFTTASAALQPDKVVTSACQFCNSLCGLRVHMKSGHIIDIRGIEEDPVQAGGLCVKAGMMADLVTSPKRLTTPLKRVDGEKGDENSRFEPISWDEALDIIAKKFLELRDSGEARAIANRTSGRLLRGVASLVGRFFELLGLPNATDVGPVCNDAGGNALAWTFGLGNFTNGYGVDPATGKEDLGSADFYMLLGTNQAETHPVTFAHLLRERAKRKSKLVVIDPRLTQTGAQADEWIAPKPHTDLALVLAMIQHIIEERWYDRRFVKRWVLGFDELESHLEEKGFTPEWAERMTGVSAATIRKLARSYAKASSAAIFCNAGISHQLNAFDTYRALAFLAAITGNIGKPGAGCNFMHNTWPGGLSLPPTKTTMPDRGPALPVGPDWFAESILNARPYRLKAVVTEGNPILSSANTEKVREAMKQLEFYVYTGLFMEEAVWYADVILPVKSGLEMDGVYMRRDDRAIRWQEAAVPAVGESRSDVEIWIDLAEAMARNDRKNPPFYWTDNLIKEWRAYGLLWGTFVKNTPGMGGMTKKRMMKRNEPLQWPCPDENHPGVSTLYLDHSTWYRALEALDPRHAGKRFPTPSGKVEIFTDEIEEKLSAVGHGALPIYYTHPEVTGGQPSIEYSRELVTNPVNGHALTPKVKLGER